MARQSFVWTALPNGYTPDGASLRVSILLSPRLDPQAGPRTLQAFFPDWKDWPTTLRKARFEVTCGANTVDVLATDTTGPTRCDHALGAPDPAVWVALFPGTLPVHPFVYRDLSDHDILSYDTVTLARYVEWLYADLAARAGDDLPLISDFVEDRRWGPLVSTIRELDRSSVDPHTGLRDPRRQFEHLRPQERGAMSLPELLERFQLFHTPPARPAPRTHQARADDPRIEAQWLEYERASLPAKADAAKTIDFHQVVAAMGSYPTLLRRLGLVVDLLVNAAAFTPAADAALSVRVTFPAGALQVTRTHDAAPVTRAHVSATQFEAVSNPAATFRVKDGLLDLDPARFALLQVDVDGAGLKVMNFARSLGRREAIDDRVDPVSRHEDRAGAPAVRTAGLMLVQRDRWRYLRARFGGNETGNASLEAQFQGTGAGPTLHAEDLVRGYRLDVWDGWTGRWRSLCRRIARYELAGGSIAIHVPDEESTVRLAATKSADPASHPTLLYLHEALATWAGWSLAAPPPGRAILPGDGYDTTRDQSEAEIPPGIDFTSTFKALPGSLPRLRFGRQYALRARAVDLAGNSLPPRLEDFGSEDAAAAAQPFLRFEPVAAPVLALRGDDGAIEVPREGESMARIAIRSFNDTPGLNAVPTTQVARRVAAPPQVSIRDAELHGMLDAGGRVDPSTYHVLAHEKDVDPRDPLAAIREVILPVQGPLGEAPADTAFAVYETGRRLTYLPDPLAIEVAARFFDLPGVASSEILTIPLYPSGVWPEARPFEIELYEAPGETPWFDAATRRLRVPVPKGVRAKVRLSMKLDAQALALMGVFAWLPGSDRDAQRARALDGQHWMLTPWREVEVVHAVQRPLLAPEITSIAVARDPGATSARPVLLAACSIDTTDRLDLLAEWHEPADEPSTGASAGGPRDVRRSDVAFHVKVTDAKTYAQRLYGARGGGHPDHVVSGPDAIGVNAVHAAAAPPAAPSVPAGGSQAPVAAKAHEFHDTRYRRIEYWFDATTRFREFLSRELLVDGGSGSEATPVDTHIKVTGPRAVTWVPSSAPPPAPHVLYVVPTFGWTRSREPDGTFASSRRGGGLRVYLDRPWNVSGYGEMLAVVLPPAGFEDDPDTTPEGHPYGKYVTQWGNDPIWDTGFVRGIAPSRAAFPLARTGPDPAGAWLPPGAPDSERDQRPGAFQASGLRPPADEGQRAGIVEVAPHDVFYDAERRLWWCDIEIDPGSAYYPFVRLALARYQPISTPGAHLSNVVLADVMSLAADRWLTVTTAGDGGTRRIAVFGVRPFESSGHHEAARAPSMSVVDLTGAIEELRPAPIARSTVVEVWVERLDEALGEDFGWQRVADAEIAGGDPAAPQPSASGTSAVPGLQTTLDRPVIAMSSATRARVASTFERLTTGPLPQLAAWETLWEGAVTRPQAPGRYRLVIAEFEEYLVDDARPYDEVPTRKDRRLVFVEHVTLTD